MWIENTILIVNLLDLNFDRKNWCDKIIEEHKKQVYSNVRGANFRLDDSFNELVDYLSPKFHDIAKEEYSQSFGQFNLLPENKNTFYAYVANEEEHREYVHNHLETSTLTCVYYLNIPEKNTGGISFYTNPIDKFLTYFPKTDDLIIFPNFLYHTPEISKSPEYRISLNMEIVCERIQTNT